MTSVVAPDVALAAFVTPLGFRKSCARREICVSPPEIPPLLMQQGKEKNQRRNRKGGKEIDR